MFTPPVDMEWMAGFFALLSPCDLHLAVGCFHMHPFQVLSGWRYRTNVTTHVEDENTWPSWQLAPLWNGRHSRLCNRQSPMQWWGMARRPTPPATSIRIRQRHAEPGPLLHLRLQHSSWRHRDFWVASKLDPGLPKLADGRWVAMK